MTEPKTNQDESSINKLSQVLDRLTTDQIRFIAARQEHSTDKDAAQAIGIKPDTVYQWTHKGVPIAEAVRLMAFDGLVTTLHIRRQNLIKAMLVKVAGLDSEKEQIRQSVATEVIEWEVGKATQKTEVTGKDGGTIKTEAVMPVDLSGLTDDEIRAAIKAAEIIGGAQAGSPA